MRRTVQERPQGGVVMRKIIGLIILSLACAASVFAGTEIKGLEAKAPVPDLARIGSITNVARTM